MKVVSLFTIPFVVHVHVAAESTLLQGMNVHLDGVGSKNVPHNDNATLKHTPLHQGNHENNRGLQNMAWYEIGQGMGTLDDNDNTRERKSRMGHAVASSASGNIVAVSSPRQATKDIVVDLDMDYGDMDELDDEDSESPPSVNMSVQYYPRVQIFEFNPQTNQWEKPSIDIESGDPLDEFGVSLAMDASGSTLVVGALDDNQFNMKDAGSITIYKYDGVMKSWIPKGTNHRIEGSAAFEHLGAAVDMSHDGKVIAVGSPNKDTIVDDADFPRGGEVKVYKYDPVEDVWNMMGRPIRGEIFDRLGFSVSIASQVENNMYILAAGAPTAGLYEAGYVQIFRLVDEGDDDMVNMWVSNIEGKIIGDADGDHFGSSVALNRNGTVFVAGAPHHKGFTLKKKSGHARVYKMHGNNIWRQVHESIVGFREGEESGSSVAISPDGDRIVVGSPFSSNNGKHSGHVGMYYLYDEEGNDQRYWDNIDLDIDGSYAMDFAGTSVAMAMNGNRVVIGSPGGGYTRVFELLKTPPPTMTPTSAVPAGSFSGTNKEEESLQEVSEEIVLLVVAIALPLVLAIMIFSLNKQIRVSLNMRRDELAQMRRRNELMPKTPTPVQGSNGDGQEGEFL